MELRTPLFDVPTATIQSIAENMFIEGLTFADETLWIADRNNNTVWALTRRAPSRPNTSVKVYGMEDAPEGLRLNPLTRVRVGTPAPGTSRGGPNRDGKYDIKYTCRSISGFAVLHQEMTVLPPVTTGREIRYSQAGFPPWAQPDLTTVPVRIKPKGVATLPEGVDEQVWLGMLTASAYHNGTFGGSASLIVPYVCVRGDQVSVEEPTARSRATTMRIEWPREDGTSFTETIDGCITQFSKTLILHDSSANRGPGIKQSWAEVTFLEEFDPRSSQEPEDAYRATPGASSQHAFPSYPVRPAR